MARVPIDADPAPADRIDKLATIYRTLADSELQGYCPIYEQLSRHMADDAERLGRYADGIGRIGMLPILLFACVHDLVLAESAPESVAGSTASDDAVRELAEVYRGNGRDPWPPFRQLLDERF